MSQWNLQEVQQQRKSRKQEQSLSIMPPGLRLCQREQIALPAGILLPTWVL